MSTIAERQRRVPPEPISGSGQLPPASPRKPYKDIEIFNMFYSNNPFHRLLVPPYS
jgi:hypothetical protein